MAKYEINPDDEGKFQCTICEYGRGVNNGKSRQSVSRHYNASHAEKSDDGPIPPKEEKSATERVNVKGAENDDSVPKSPDWLTFDMSAEDEDPATVSLSPTAASVLKGMAAGADPPSSPKALKEFYEQQGKMMKWVFAGVVDPVFSWYGKGITTDPQFTVKRSKADWELFEQVSANWLEYHGIQLPVTPDIIFGGTLLSFYAPVMVKIHRQRDPKKPSLLKRWRSRRAMRKSLKSQSASKEA